MAMARLLQLPWMRERNDAHRMNRARGGGKDCISIAKKNTIKTINIRYDIDEGSARMI
jgi:hypothetical protein